jgi:hypothetical protein
MNLGKISASALYRVQIRILRESITKRSANTLLTFFSMPELRRYDGADETPREMERQIRSLMQAEWPAPGDETGGPLVAPEWHPTYFILAEGEIVWSYTRTVWARVTHLGRSLKLYGLGDVVTAPGLRLRVRQPRRA